MWRYKLRYSSILFLLLFQEYWLLIATGWKDIESQSHPNSETWNTPITVNFLVGLYYIKPKAGLKITLNLTPSGLYQSVTPANSKPKNHIRLQRRAINLWANHHDRWHSSKNLQVLLHLGCIKFRKIWIFGDLLVVEPTVCAFTIWGCVPVFESSNYAWSYIC